MKIRKLIAALALTLASAGVANAEFTAPVPNLTPLPAQMTVGSGYWTLPAGVKVSVAGLPDSLSAEVTRFVADLNRATGLGAATVTDASAAQIAVTHNAALPAEGYKLTVTATGASVEAATATGLYFAFQSMKKMMPANVMAGVAEPAVTTWQLPVVSISDKPRFPYRGFMLDCSRHFYTIDEVKRMLDVMSYYKLNRFHWHLTDDQGWRIEMPQYPRLTTIGATAPNRRFTDMNTKSQYWINHPYGPYFYTQDELREVVAYAKERHIEVIPEVDMPGHFCAAMAAYPEFSCNPGGSHSVWDDGGISSDVLNVANPAAVQFAKDVLTTLMDIFPYPTVHIGGDECPTSAWENNAECKELYKQIGATSWRQLQSHFIMQLNDHVKAAGRNLSMWDESISANGANTEQVKSTDAFIYCWTVGTADAAAKLGTSLGLRCIYTPWGPYYINRRQNQNDPPGAGDGTDDVRATYERVPFRTVDAANAEYCYGVQGTFWCEHVSDREYMEYLALPRLIAIAEAGWTAQNRRDFADFQKRMTADTKLLDYGGYRYSTYHMLNQGEGTEPPVSSDPVKPQADRWYRLVSQANSRENLCVELLSANSPKIGTGNAAEWRLWSNNQAQAGDANYDWQFWQFRPDPAGSGRYAMVCKAAPEGSVKPTPTAQNNTGRWDYDPKALHYDFTIDTDTYYGETSEGVYHYAITSTGLNAGNWMNMALGGQNFAINVFNDPTDGNGGIFHFHPLGGASGSAHPWFEPFTTGQTLLITNVVTGLEGITVADVTAAALLGYSADPWSANAWTVTSAVTNADNSQTLRLRNASTERFIGATGTYAARSGRPVNMTAADGVDVTIYRNADTPDFTVAVDGKALWPNPSNGNVHAGGNVSADGFAPRGLGTAWSVEAAKVVTYTCTDTDGKALGTFTRTMPANADAPTLAPEIKNHTVTDVKATGNSVAVTYKRTAASLTYVCRDAYGSIVTRVEVAEPVGTVHTVKAPELDYYHDPVVATDAKTITLTADTELEVTYQSDAVPGIKAIGAAVTKLENGRSYLIYDAHSERYAYRYAATDGKIYGVRSISSHRTPYATWLMEGSGAQFAVKNLGHNLYFPAVTSGGCPALSASPAKHTFNYSAATDQWTVKSGSLFWNGNSGSDLSMAGWSDGHPYQFFEYEAAPYFAITVKGVDIDGKELFTNHAYAEAGQQYVLVAPFRAGLAVKSIEGNEELLSVSAPVTVTITYADPSQVSLTDVETAATAPTGIYDLMGRRLPAATRPGLYIINGQKVAVK